MTFLPRVANSGAALKAFQDFHDYLQSELLSRPSPKYACGAEFFDLLMNRGHMVRESAEEFLRFAKSEFERHAGAQPVPDTPVIYDLEEHTKCWEACRRVVQDQDLLNWPDFPITFTRPPDLLRDVAQDLYYLAYRSPAAF